ncbi:HRDC-domain-containing protein [Hypoxylon trugodes]|uniref:HRDC-domain-containing protein n=1 Tax=Hypoxylon trugodes TaxID=326681 RepID=UPI002195D925|nr:HRDC-domain-containing protein [Hypoxylon trugodes]KAI1393623.1 HRDC-domain-containing protein [Hypoxylon trugodes]
MLFHCMNAKRLQMDPIPPLPKLAESQSSSAMEPAASVQPESSGDDAALALRKLLEAQKLKPRKDTHVEETKIKTPTTPKERQHHVQEKTEYGKSPVRNPVPEPSPRIYSELVSHRKELAKTLNYAPYIIATNKMLEALATYRPSNRSELAKIRGIGAREVEEYGDEWLQIIAKDLAEHPEETRSPLQPITPNRRVREKRNNHKPMDPTLTQELFQRLSEHRKACAATNKWAAFRVASNSTLNDLVQSRPSNEEELLRVEGIGKHKASLYGPDWLRIISEFEAKHDLQPESSHLARNTPLTHPQYQIQSESDSEPEFEHQPSEHPSKRMRVRNIGRSKEIILTKPLLSSNPSLELADALFKAGEASIEKDRVEHDDSYESTLEVSMTASISLKRKRTDDATSPSKAIHTSPSSPSPNPILNSITTPTPTDPPIEVAPPPQRLSWQQQLLRRKLDACVKSVIWATNPKHTQPIVSEDTLHCLVTTLPQTLDEFHKVPGIQYFIQACQRVNKDLWSTFSKWIEVQGLVKSSSTSGQ